MSTCDANSARPSPTVGLLRNTAVPRQKCPRADRCDGGEPSPGADVGPVQQPPTTSRTALEYTSHAGGLTSARGDVLASQAHLQLLLQPRGLPGERRRPGSRLRVPLTHPGIGALGAVPNRAGFLIAHRQPGLAPRSSALGSVIPKHRDGLTRLSLAREDHKPILGHLVYVLRCAAWLLLSRQL